MLRGHAAVASGLRVDVELRAEQFIDEVADGAAVRRDESVVAALLAKGAKVGLATNDGDTPFSMAQDQGHDSVVALLTTRPNM